LRMNLMGSYSGAKYLRNIGALRPSEDGVEGRYCTAAAGAAAT